MHVACCILVIKNIFLLHNVLVCDDNIFLLFPALQSSWLTDWRRRGGCCELPLATDNNYFILTVQERKEKREWEKHGERNKMHWARVTNSRHERARSSAGTKKNVNNELYVMKLHIPLWGGSWRVRWVATHHTWRDILVGNYFNFLNLLRNYNYVPCPKELQTA